MSEWVEKKFRDFIKLNRGFDLPNDRMVEGQYPVVASTNIKGFHNEYKINPPAVITGRSGSLGIVQYIEKKCTPLNTTLYTKDFKGNNPKFVYYFLQTMHLEVFNSGAGVPTLNQNHLHSVKLRVPPLPTQTRIAEILSAYDDTIENNNHRIALLDKAASELCREWFVRMRFPGHESAKVVNGLPEEWEVRRLGEFCHVTDGTHDTPKQVDVGIPLVTGKHINNGFIDFKSTYLISEADHIKISKRSGLESGDILLSNIGTVGSTCIVNYDREFSVKNVIILKPKSEVKTAYLYYLMTSQAIQDILSVQTNGASQQFVGLTFMRRFKILIPSERILNRFAEQITPILTEKQTVYAKSQNLARQRDLLLPRLMSGKMEV